MNLDYRLYCTRYDHSGQDELSDREWFNVLKIQNGVECNRDQVFN